MAESTLNERVAEEIRVALARKQISATELARKAGMTQRSVSRRVTGEKAIDMDDLERIARALDVPVAELLPTPARTPKGGSAPATQTATRRIGQTDPALAKPPQTYRLNRRRTRATSPRRNGRPVRLSTPAPDGAQ